MRKRRPRCLRVPHQPSLLRLGCLACDRGSDSSRVNPYTYISSHGLVITGITCRTTGTSTIAQVRILFRDGHLLNLNCLARGDSKECQKKTRLWKPTWTSRQPLNSFTSSSVLTTSSNASIQMLILNYSLSVQTVYARSFHLANARDSLSDPSLRLDQMMLSSISRSLEVTKHLTSTSGCTPTRPTIISFRFKTMGRRKRTDENLLAFLSTFESLVT